MSKTTDFRIVVPFLPPLSHLAMVKVAISFYGDFGGVKLNIKFREIQTKNSDPYIQCYIEEDEGYFTVARKSLRFMPVLLRKRFMETLHGLQYEVIYWRLCHKDLKSIQKKINFYWRSDGTIDTIKTLNCLILDQSIDVRKRFEIACKYCLEGSIYTLWSKMELSGEAEDFDAKLKMMARFWITYMRSKSEVPWKEAAAEHFRQAQDYILLRPMRCCSFFSVLKPADRREFLRVVLNAEYEDFWLCLLSVTVEEEEEIMKGETLRRVIQFYLKWPLQRLFLERLENMWKYIDYDIFKETLSIIMKRKDSAKDCDYCELFENFWNKSPNPFKQSAKEDPDLRDGINLYLGEIRQKREAFNNLWAEFDSNANRKNKKSGNGEVGIPKNRKKIKYSVML